MPALEPLFVFGEKSKEELNTVDRRLREVMVHVLTIMDITVLEGRRSWARQQELLDRKPKPATTLEPGESKHNPPDEDDLDWLSLAVDVAPYPVDWEDPKRFIYMAGIIISIGAALGYKIRWGGNWDMDSEPITDQDFQDLVHFELLGG